MNNLQDTLDGFSKIFKSIEDVETRVQNFNYNENNYSLPNIEQLEVAEFNPEDTIIYEMKKQNQQQIDLMTDQNDALRETVDTLNDLLKKKDDELENAKNENTKITKYNFWMMLITIVSTIVSIVSLIISFITI